MLARLLALSPYAFPGPQYLQPKIHFAPTYVSDHGGWHDVAGAFTMKDGVHHIFQGTGWNHAVSSDLVRWSMAPHGPKRVHETYAGMDSDSDPCSGFVTMDKDGDGKVCAGFRQCGSRKGVAGGHPWDVPLELRCASDENLTVWNDAHPEYLFNVSFWRGIPYDPARPWKEKDGLWYVLLSMDACNTTNATERQHGCAAGGQLHMWRSPALRGAAAAWEPVGAVFTSNETVLSGTIGAHLVKEFVTIDYIGRLPGDPRPEGVGTRLFLNNVGGNGGGVGCCSGTTSYFPVTQAAPGAPLEQVAPQGMVDWGAFQLKLPLPPSGSGGLAKAEGASNRKADDEVKSEAKDEAKDEAAEAAADEAAAAAADAAAAPTGLALLEAASRGLSMARTLGSPEPDQVSLPGRRVLIGWTGPSIQNVLSKQGSAQSLPRDLSLAPDLSLRQAFVPELQRLRQAPPLVASGRDAWFPRHAGLQAEVLATFPPSCAAAHAGCGVSVLGDALGGTTITLAFELGLVLVDATSQGNGQLRAGPLPPPAAGAAAWVVHVIADHSLVEVIVNNATAFVVYATPATAAAGHVRLVGAPADPSGAGFTAWTLADPGHHYW